MAEIELYNHFSKIDYPFVNLGSLNDNTLEEKIKKFIVDARITFRAESGFIVGEDRLWLDEITIDPANITLIFKTDCAKINDKSFTIVVVRNNMQSFYTFVDNREIIRGGVHTWEDPFTADETLIKEIDLLPTTIKSEYNTVVSRISFVNKKRTQWSFT